MVTLVQEYFTQSAQKFPDKLAVNCKDENTTYAELDQVTNKIAHLLVEVGVQRNDRVAFCLAKSVDSVRSVLSAVKADACYVPLDAKSPIQRLQYIVEDCQPKVIICNDGSKAKVEELVQTCSMKPIIVNLSENEYEMYSHEKRTYTNTGNDLAYILYTSGSTGQPKGVMISHANIIHFIEWAVARFQITPEDRLSNHAPMHFDLSTWDLYCTFKMGASLYIIPYEVNLFPKQLVEYIEQREITIWLSVPSILVYMARVGVLTSESIPSVKKVFSTGEVFPTPYIVEWMNMFPHKTFINMFGPTETTVECTYYIIEKPTDISKNIPIGKGCEHLEVFALKEDGTEATVGETGELYVRGPSVSRGYWNNPQKTEQAFVKHPLFPFLNEPVYKTGDLVELNEQGDYIFRGRIDNQIKFMGYRIELGEIEAALNSLPYVREASVIFIDKDTDSEIVSHLCLKEETPLEKLKIDLAELVPKYMVPKTIKTMVELPRTSTGKIDRVKLKKEYLHDTQNGN